jgi:hypothetical protein
MARYTMPRARIALMSMPRVRAVRDPSIVHAPHMTDAPTRNGANGSGDADVRAKRRVPGLRLFDIKCAWFNEDEYCEMA